ncbi:glycosyltransferase family 2 protein [Bacteroides thetaiotaomicron]|uniref:glycosyltransferase family 2 protein n=1 Tax=Bacteroides thetaiotaomicron TaxID=818 RepID=UPI0034A0FB25
MIDISIITVGMNHLLYLKVLLRSLYKENIPQASIEMIYVDNCSSDGTVEYIRQNYPQVRIVENQKPLGFGENNNKGVLASIGKYIAIINPDIVLHKGSLDFLYEYVEKHPIIGITVPKLLNPDGTVQYSVRSFITLKVLFSRFLSKGNDQTTSKIVNKYLCKNMDTTKIQPVDWAIGAALFMRRDFYVFLGGFDQNYFLYMEDEDICLRSWKCNRPVVYFPESIMTHNHLRGSSKIGRKALLHLQSMFVFFKKHGCSIGSFCSKMQACSKLEYY